MPNVQGGKSKKKFTLYDGDVVLRNCKPNIKYYRFEKGDKIQFSFRKKKGKKIESFKIFIYPDIEIYQQTEVEDNFQYVVDVPERAIYGIEVIGGSCVARKKIAHIKVERTPLNDSLEFRTIATFKTIQDTSYFSETIPVLIRRDSAIVKITDEMVKISSQNALNGNPNKATVSFEIPKNTVNCSYYIGVGQNGSAAYDKSISNHLNSTALSLANPWYALMVFGLDRFLSVNSGDNVKFWVTNVPTAAETFMSQGLVPSDFLLISFGDVLNATKSFTKPKSGKVTFLLLNDNIMDPIYVRIVASALTVVEVFEDQTFRRMKVVSKQVPAE